MTAVQARVTAETINIALHESSQLREYPLFDWLRFILASAVVLSHSGVIQWDQGGNLAVQVFFSLSGWLIGGILLRTDRKEMPRFFFNRATRVWLPYAFTVTALYALSLYHDQVTLRWLEFLFYDATFTHNWFSLRPDAASALAQMPLRGTGNHFWSIAIEEQFYLAAPLVIVFSDVGKRAAIWLLISALLIVLDTGFGSIGLGVLAATLQREFGDWQLPPTMASIVFGVLIGSSVAMMLPKVYWIASPIFAISVVLLASRPSIRGPVGKFVGGISYPLYLNAWMGAFVVNALMKRMDITSIVVHQMLTYLTAVAAGSIAYFLIDRNVLSRRGAFYNQSLGRFLGAAAYTLVGCGLIVGLYRWGW